MLYQSQGILYYYKFPTCYIIYTDISCSIKCKKQRNCIFSGVRKIMYSMRQLLEMCIVEARGS